MELELAALDVGGQFFQLVGVGAVDFGGAHDHGFAGEGVVGLGRLFGVVGERVVRFFGDAAGEIGQLFVDDLEVFDGIWPAGGVGDVDEVDEQACALNVAEELDAEAGTKVRAFNKARHVGDDEGFLVGLFADGDYAEVGFESGEGVVGDFGASGGDAGDQGGLAGVGETDQAYIGEELEFEAVEALFAGAAEFVLAGSLVGAGGEVLIATAAAAAFGDDELLVGLLEVVDELAGFLVVKGCSDRDLQDDGFAVEAGAVGAQAMLAALGLVLGVIAEMDEGVVALGGDHDDVAATASVAAGGTAAGDKLFAPEGHAAVTAVAGFDLDFCFIDEHKRPGIRDQGSEISVTGDTRSFLNSKCRLFSLLE